MTTQCNIREVKLNIQLLTSENTEGKMELPFYDDGIKVMELYTL